MKLKLFSLITLLSSIHAFAEIPVSHTAPSSIAVYESILNPKRVTSLLIPKLQKATDYKNQLYINCMTLQDSTSAISSDKNTSCTSTNNFEGIFYDQIRNIKQYKNLIDIIYVNTDG